MSKLISICAILSGFCPVIALAYDEGFSISTEKSPSAVKAAWDATFLITSTERGSSGTAFMFVSKQNTSNTKIYFLTNEHVVADLGCDQVGPCPALQLFHDYAFSSDLRSEFADGINPFMASHLTIEKISKNPDLALLSVETSEALSALRPISVDECSNEVNYDAYLIGYPAIWRREQLKVDLNVRKRLSIGKALTFLRNQPPVTAPTGFLWLNNDSLPGNSGSAAVTATGAFLGILKKSNSLDDNHFQYNAQNKDGDEIPQTYLIPCQTLKAYLSPDQTR